MSTGDLNTLTAIIDGGLGEPERSAWLAAHPELAIEAANALRVRALLRQLAAAELAVPVGFEARLLARISADKTLLDLLDLCLSGAGRAALELLNLFFALAPGAPEQATAYSAPRKG
jgi:anti-sigma factor RsiW